MKRTTWSNLSPSETYRMYGALTRDQIEELIACGEGMEKIDGATGYIDEAKGSFPDEDFLAKPIKAMQELAKSVRGANREALEKIIAQLSEIQTTTYQQAEYGLEQLESAATAIAQAQG